LNSRGAQLAAEEINGAGGVMAEGKPYQIQLTVEDDAGQPTRAINSVNKLIQEKKVIAILGPEFSNVVIPTVAITTKHKVIQLYSTNSTAYSGPVAPAYAFRNRVEDTYLSAAAVSYVKNELRGSERRVGISHLNNEFGRSGAENLKDELKTAAISVVAVVGHNFRDQDLTPNAAAMISNGADVVITWTGPSEAILLLRTLKHLGWKGELIHGNTDSVFIKIGEKEVEGVIGPQGWVPSDLTEKSQNFVRAYTKRFNQMPDTHAASYYDSVYLLKSAIEKAGLEPENIRGYLASLDGLIGVQGKFHPADLKGGNTLTKAVLVRVEGGQLKLLRSVSE
jgi:branched-chain amino acid transport system substrate-binding protein